MSGETARRTTPHPAHDHQVYAGGTHDRASIARRDAAWMEAALAAEDALFLPVWRDLHLVTEDAGGPAIGLLPREALGIDPALGPLAFLGLRDGQPVFAADISTLDEAALPGAFCPIRPVAGNLPARDAALVAQGRSVLSWQAANRFCGRCGAPNRAEEGGGRLRCTSDAGHIVFPRVDPVAIMLVRCGDRALVAQGTRFPPERTLYSALAGFIEPGESAEEAVAREVFEETGVRVHNVRYVASQPWPYPGALMLGFMADASDMALTLDPEEIRDARWISRAEAASPEAHGFTIPGPAAIAHYLIATWRAEDATES